MTDAQMPRLIVKAAAKAAQMREQCLLERRSLGFVGTDDPSINAKRVAMRVMEGGHDVPISKIISRYTRSLANCSVAAGLAHRAYIYDNSVDDAPARLLFRMGEGKLVKSYANPNPWVCEILRQIDPDTASIG